MKKMTCHDLGGACDLIFKAETFAEMAELSKAHGGEMFAQMDEAHLEAMRKMKEMMQTPDAMQKWFAEKQANFDGLPDILNS